MILLEENSDHKIVHQRIITPPLVSNRSMIQTFYEDRVADGTITYLSTTTGNQNLEKKYAKILKDDVMAFCFITFIEVKPNIGANGITGSYIKLILSIDLGGSLPDFVKKFIGEA